MLSVVESYKDYQFVIAGAPSQSIDIYKEIIGVQKNISIVFGKTYPLLLNSHAGLITSGTATLETALFKIPQVVCYKANPISYRIAKRLVKIKFISLVNLIMDTEIVRELIQHELTTKNLILELGKLLEGEYRDKLLIQYDELIIKLGGVGASANTAQHIITHLKTQ